MQGLLLTQGHIAKSSVQFSVHILFELSVALNTISWKHFFLGFDDTLLLVFLRPHWQFLFSLP